MINFKQPHEILNQFKQYENPYDFSNEKIMVRFDDAIKAMVEYSDQFKHLHKPVVVRGVDSENQLVQRVQKYFKYPDLNTAHNTPTEPLGNEGEGKAGAVEVLNIKTGQLLIVDGYGFMFGKDLNTGEIKCFNIENVRGESREGALH